MSARKNVNQSRPRALAVDGTDDAAGAAAARVTLVRRSSRPPANSRASVDTPTSPPPRGFAASVLRPNAPLHSASPHVPAASTSTPKAAILRTHPEFPSTVLWADPVTRGAARTTKRHSTTCSFFASSMFRQSLEGDGVACWSRSRHDFEQVVFGAFVVGADHALTRQELSLKRSHIADTCRNRLARAQPRYPSRRHLKATRASISSAPNNAR
jgi:hypothetical protein